MKKVALFIGQLFEEYQIEVTKSLEAEAKRRGYRLDVFINFGVYGNNFMYAEGEMSMIRLPHFDDYAGIIMATDTFELPGYEEELVRYVKKNYQKPLISLRTDKDDVYSIIIDDEKSMEMMVEHFITAHHFDRICFMTGKMNMTDAQRRLQGYKNVMEKYNIPITEHMVFEGDYWRNAGTAAVDWFFDQDERPQAIICSNDYMAISVCDVLRDRGIKVPEEVAVSGFDDLDEAKFYVPSMTTMRVPTDKMGVRAIELLDEILAGKDPDKKQMVPVNQQVRGSCGCGHHFATESMQTLLKQKVKLENVLAQVAYMSVSFDNADSIESLMQTANFYARRLPFSTLYICFNDQEELDNLEEDDKPPYSEHMILNTILGGNEPLFVEERFERSQLLPDKYLREGQTLYTVALHDRVDYFGYVAMYVDELNNIQHIFQIWLLALADALGKLKMYKDSEALSELREKYEIDALTGIGNRRKLERVVRNKHERLSSLGERFGLVSVDMDDLKVINDTYGHPEGDKALTGLAHILEEECRGDGAAARMGGDEFAVCLDYSGEAQIKDYIARIRRRIDEDNASGAHKYTLSASIGYVLTQKDVPLMESIMLADDKMYEEKRCKKKVRSRRI